MSINRNLIFNPKGDDNISVRKIIKGNITGLFNLNDVKYNWAKASYQVMIGNFWVPEKVNGLGDDSNQYKRDLSPGEQRAYKGILSFLIFLDSIQTVNLPNFSEYITSAEVKLLLSIQSYQEAIHSQSYAVILETVVDAKEREDIYYFWRDDEILLERNKFIGGIYQEFIDNPNEKTLFRGIVGNYLLEGLYFYNGFAFFDTLAYQGKMNATQRMINYIRRDELTHVSLFANIMKEIRKEFPEIFDEKVIYEMMGIAVEQDVKWSKHIINESVIGMTNENIENYTKWLANQRLLLIGLKPLYDVSANPFKHLDMLQNNNSEKSNFFESTVSNYTQSSSLNGTWDF